MNEKQARLSVFYTLLTLSVFTLTSPVNAELNVLHRGSSDKIILFVHGLSGDPETTFKSESADLSWPEMFAADERAMRAGPPLSEYSIGIMSFPAGRDDRLSTKQVSDSLQRNLYDEGIIDDYGEIFIIAHSLGGIVVKELYSGLVLEGEDEADADAIKGVLLIATPSQGAPVADFLSKLPEIVTGELVLDIKEIGSNTYLQALESKWVSQMRRREDGFPKVYCAYETKPTNKVFKVVPAAYASTVCDITPSAMNEDHLTIVKPSSRDDEIYGWARGRIAAIQKALDAPKISSAMPSGNGQSSGSISEDFNDDFTNGANVNWQNVSGEWAMSNGQYTITGIQSEQPYSVILGNRTWTNLDMSVVVNPGDAGINGSNIIGVCPRVVGKRSMLCLSLIGKSSYSYGGLKVAGWLMKKSGKTGQMIGATEIDVAANKSVEIVIEVRDGHYSAYMDGVFITDYSNSDSELESGGVGLLQAYKLKGGHPKQPITFDNVSVKSVSIGQ